MATYTPTVWVNDAPPPLSAANLNKLSNELRAQATAKSIANTLPTWVDNAAPALTDAAPLNEMERVALAVAQSLGLTYARTTWSNGWVPARNASNLNKLENQAAANRAALDNVVVVWRGPQTITQGGVYNDNWQSTDGSPAIRIQTTAPVTISGRVRQTLASNGGGYMIDAYNGAPSGSQITIENLYVEGPDVDDSPRWFVCQHWRTLIIRNCTIVNTRGIELWPNGYPNPTTLIEKCRHTNIKGTTTNSELRLVGNFVQLRQIGQATVIEARWNEIINEYDKSNPEDVFSVFKTSNCYIHDNYIQHQSKPPRLAIGTKSSQNTITMDHGAGAGPDPNLVRNNRVEDNQIVDAHSVGMFGGYDNSFLRNRIVSDQNLPNGQRKPYGYQGLYINTGFTGNIARQNIVGYMQGSVESNGRLDWTLTGSADASPDSLNTHMPDPIDATDEAAEWTFWQNKLASNNIVIGATTAAPPPPTGDWTTIAQEWDNFTVTTATEVRYGEGSFWVSQVFQPGTYQCSTTTFGSDPISGTVKHCEARLGSPTQTYLLDEDFTGTSLNPRWGKRWWWGGDSFGSASTEQQAYRDSQVFLDGNSNLVMRAIRQNVTDTAGTARSWISGMVQTNGYNGASWAGPYPDTAPTFTFTYGKVECRMKVPKGVGIFPALWLCDAGFPSSCTYEIDILEVVGWQPRVAQYNVHLNGVNAGSSYTHSADLGDAFHIYGFEWRPTFLAYSFDGVERWRYTGSNIPTNPHYIIFNLAMGGSWPGPTDGTTPSPSDLLVDYIRVSA